MSSTDHDLDNLLSNVEKFLQQQRELYGEMLLRPEGDAPAAQPEESHSSEHTSHEHEVKKPLSPETQDDLFGQSAPSAARSPRTRSGKVPSRHYPDEPWVQAPDIEHLDAMINTCMKCGLGKTRTNFVFGVGNPHADLVLIGEAPGADEDAQGEPFVGRAGQLLTKILGAIGFKREDVYICNILKCRPPNNREPLPDEVELCEPYLWKQLELLQPKLILCLGRVAAKALLKTNESLAALRGKLHDYHGTRVMVTYHPAALLRNPNWKRPTWEDVQKARKLYDEFTADQS